MPNLISLISLLLMIEFSTNASCSGILRGRYRVCDGESGAFVLEDGHNKKFQKIGDHWNECVNSVCNKLENDKLVLYFETALIAKLSESFMNLESEINSPLSCINYSETKIEKSNGASQLIDLRQYFTSKKDELIEVSKYHMRYYENLNSLIHQYNKSTFVLSDKSFKKSDDYNMYERPVTYMKDLNTYKTELLQAEESLEWMYKLYDLNELNISLNLKDNRRVAYFFNKFKEESGFPDNLEELKSLIRKKIENIDKEKEYMIDWLLQKGISNRLEFENQLPRKLKFASLISERRSALKTEFEFEFLTAQKEKDYARARNAYRNYIERLGKVENILSLQVTSDYKKSQFTKFITDINTERDNIRHRFEKADFGLSKGHIDNDGTPLGGGDPPSSRDVGRDNSGDTGGVDLVEIRISVDEIPSVTSIQKLSTEALKKLNAKEVLGVVDVDNNLYLTYRTENGDTRAISLVELDKLNEHLQNVFSEHPVLLDPSQPLTELENNLEAKRHILMKSEIGRDVYNSALELKVEATKVAENKERVEKEIEDKIVIASERRNEQNLPSKPLPRDVEPPTSSDNVLQDMALNLIYYGVDFIPVVSDVKDVAELISALYNQTDLTGASVDDVDTLLIGLGLLIPHLRKIPGVKNSLELMLKYIKSDKSKALNYLLKIFKKGKGAIEKLLIDIEKGVEAGFDIFIDLGGEFLENAGEIITDVSAGDWNNLFKTKKMKPSDIVDISNSGSTKLADKLKMDLKIPAEWDVNYSDKGEGMRISRPGTSKADDIRIMPGGGTNPHQKEPYVIVSKGGNTMDVNGSIKPRTSPDVHLNLEDFKFPDWL